MGLAAKNDGGSGSDTSRDAWLLDVAESRPTQPAAFAPCWVFGAALSERPLPSFLASLRFLAARDYLRLAEGERNAI